MIKAVGERDGRPLLILGLSGENMTRLMAAEPILVDCAQLGLPRPAGAAHRGPDRAAHRRGDGQGRADPQSVVPPPEARG